MVDIFVQSKSDLITSKQGRKYFTIKNEEDETFICFNPKLHDLFQLGSTVIDVETEAGKKQGDTTRIVSVGHKEEVSPSVETSHKNEIAPQEKGMWWKEVGENFRAGLFKKDDNANGSLLWRAYIAQMLASLEIKIEKSK